MTSVERPGARPGHRARPLPVALVAWLFIAAGIVGGAYHASELDPKEPFGNDALWVLLIRLLAIVAGAFMLRGAAWARWLTLAWLAYHVVLSALHSVSETVTHLVVLAVVALVLFRPASTAFFRSSRARSGQPGGGVVAGP